MRPGWRVLVLAAAVAVVLSSQAAERLSWSLPSTNKFRDLAPFLEGFRRDLKFPALAAAVVRGAEVEAAGAVGERKIDSGIRVGIDDRFHIGSCTKSITALLAARLVAEGKLKWTSRGADLLSDWSLRGEVANIPLSLLLQNQAGIGNTPSPDLWARAYHGLKGSPAQQRREFLEEFLKEPLAAKPGTTYLYSNIGFALAGAMIETGLNQSWEELVRHYVFDALHLPTAGFGAPATLGKVDAPWGHQLVVGKVTPIDSTDNPVAIAPAGAAHMSVLDLASYAAFHRDLYNGKIAELKGVRSDLYTPPSGSDYAMGWIVQKRSWAGGEVLTHAGSNTMFYAVIWIAPVKDLAFVVMTNMGDREGNTVSVGVDTVVAGLIKEFVR